MSHINLASRALPFDIFVSFEFTPFCISRPAAHISNAVTSFFRIQIYVVTTSMEVFIISARVSEDTLSI